MESSMDIILSRIIETDKASRERVNEKKQRLISIDAEINDAKNAIDSELSAAREKAVAKQTETAEIKLKKEIARIDGFYAEAEENLKASFNESREALIDTIFAKITE